MPARFPIPLNRLLSEAGIEPIEFFGLPDVPVAGIEDHAQSVGRHYMFIARRGTTVDSHQLAAEAVRCGASVILVDRPVEWFPGTTIVRVPDTRQAAGPLCQAFHNHPARRMLLAGVTGTNGKTTVTHLLESILRTAGMRTGLLGTLYYRWNDRSRPAATTTPSALSLGSLLAQMEADRVEAVVMEVSSHAIDQQRIAGLPFRVGALTNVTQDHLDYHHTMPEYIGVKRRFFLDHVAHVPGSSALLNLDDPVGEELFYTYAKHKLGYSLDPDRSGSIQASMIQASDRSNRFVLSIEGRKVEVESPLCGIFNIYNMLAAAGMAHCVGVDPATIAEGLRRLRTVPGRFERIEEGQHFRVVVDYAHTPAALDRMLHSARRITPGRLITVFGCGGRRDPFKRPLMGQVVGKYTDLAIVTNDNSRNEDPELIARQAHQGLLESGLRPNQAQILLDRRVAIEAAIRLAHPDDTVVIAGRGHEQYQDLGNQVIPFDDREVAVAVLRHMVEEGSTPDRTQPGTADPRLVAPTLPGPNRPVRNPIHVA